MNDGKRFALWEACTTEYLDLTLAGLMEEIAWRRNRIQDGGLLQYQFDELAREVNNKAYDCKLIVRILKDRAFNGERISELAKWWED